MTRWTRAAFGPLVGLVLLAGCGPSQPAQTDPEKGKQVLQTVLDAWTQGQTLQALKSRSPAIHASDPDWAGGAKLERYEIKSEGRFNGYDYSCPVTLWLRSGSGGVKSRNVSYTVGTGSALVVLRDMGS